jgi:hypothetical protein
LRARPEHLDNAAEARRARHRHGAGADEEEERELSDKTNDATSRRRVLAGGAAVLAGAAGLATRAARAQQKLAQSAVQYQEQPKDGQMCSGCVNFVAPNACKIVDGTINPNGWCIAYAPKSS